MSKGTPRLLWPFNVILRLAEQPNGCLLWTGKCKPDGYARVSRFGKLVYAHRAMYELIVGPIPAGWTVDHTCHSADPSCRDGKNCLHRRCMNVAHMQAVPHSVNASRRHPPPRPTHCPHGHEYDEENTYYHAASNRYMCRRCLGNNTKRRYRKSACPGLSFTIVSLSNRGTPLPFPRSPSDRSLPRPPASARQ